MAPSDPAVRTCVGCRDRAARVELLRVVAGTDASGRPAVVPDPRRTAPGRGAHLHPTPECLESAVRRRAFTRALRSSVGLEVGPVAEYLSHLDALHRTTFSTTPTDQDWSTSS